MACDEKTKQNLKKKKKKIEHLVTTGMIEGNRLREKHLEKMLDGLTKWLKVGQVIHALKLSNER